MNFSSNLRYLRKERGMSQEDLADKLGYKSFTTIQKWETGISEPSVSTVKIIASIFGVTMDQMINGDLCDASPSSLPAPLQLSDQEEHLVITYRQLNDDGQSKLLEYGDDLVASGRYGLSDLEAQMWKDADEIAQEEYENATRLTKRAK